VLRNSFWWSTNRLNGGFYDVRNSMDLRFLNHLIVRYIPGGNVARVEPHAVPDATNVVPRKNLCKPACFYVTNFNEPRIEEENIGRMESNTIGAALPFNSVGVTTRIALFIDINTKF
jgi:hypothetical protein